MPLGASPKVGNVTPPGPTKTAVGEPTGAGTSAPHALTNQFTLLRNCDPAAA